MPVQESKAGRLTWAPGEKPAVIAEWLVQVASHPDVGLPGLRVAVLIADRANSKSGACWIRKQKMAAALGVSVSAIKAGLAQLDAAELIIRVQEVVREVSMRVIYPRDAKLDPERVARPPASDNRPVRRLNPDDPNGELADFGLVARIERELMSLGYIPTDRRRLTNAAGAAAQAALEQGRDAFTEWCKKLTERERDLLTTERLSRSRNLTLKADGFPPDSRAHSWGDSRSASEGLAVSAAPFLRSPARRSFDGRSTPSPSSLPLT